ncbi:MAG: hypothetical protein ACKOKB_05625 [Bacteroidota bacterium]
MIRFLIAISFLWVCCGKPSNIRQVDLPSADGRKVCVDSVLDANPYTAFLFFSPECPVCIHSVPELLSIDSVFKSIVFVYPGTYYNNERILKFHQEYGIGSVALLDTANLMVELLNAEVMPQSIVVDQDGKVIYSGAIDNRTQEFGETRQVVTQRYLGAVLDSLAAGSSIPFATTTAHGCYIER